ncbi:jacalin-related lectin 19-like [Zingiber officinale]|uniref:jacalin-related lectin 19-like n=1 Tax=Zingiber officinale TaxID=94328 RepID=UPI001C4C5F08|nr:jacalin-related lectin 19-like [Zingiber officinale]
MQKLLTVSEYHTNGTAFTSGPNGRPSSEIIANLKPYLTYENIIYMSSLIWERMNTTFVSNEATYEAYGEENGRSTFTLHAQGGKIASFFARSGPYLDTIGIYTT